MSKGDTTREKRQRERERERVGESAREEKKTLTNESDW
jgi:hypothetical protein